MDWGEREISESNSRPSNKPGDLPLKTVKEVIIERNIAGKIYI
jgi:hypothetical protein